MATRSGGVFCWKLRGGAWCGANRGVAFDCYASYAVQGTEAVEFVATYRTLRNSASFSILAYGDEAALTMARGWIHRMYFLLTLWLVSGCDVAMMFTDDVVAGYEEPVDLSELAERADRACLARIAQIRGIMPR